MQVVVFVVIMEVVFSAVHYAHDYFYAGGCYAPYYLQVAVSVVAMYVTASISNFIFLSLTDIHFS